MPSVIKKILKITGITAIFLAIFFAVSYLYLIPNMVSNPDVIEKVEYLLKKNCNAELSIINPELSTSIKPHLEFKVDSLTLTKDNELLLNLKNFDCKLGFKQIYLRKISLEKLGADEIYADINKLQNLRFKQEEKKKQGGSFFKIDCKEALFYIKKCKILYTSKNNVEMKLLARNLEISNKRDPKFVHFGIYLDLYHNKEHLRLFLKDKDNVYFKNRQLHVDNMKFIVNHSTVYFNALVEKNGYDLTFKSDKFEINNVNLFLNTNLIIPNGSTFVSSFKDFDGDFNFNINVKNDGTNGIVKINKVKAKLIPVADVPLTLTSGTILLNPKDITFKDFIGYYGSNTRNKLTLIGNVFDYTKTAKTDISVSGVMTDEFARYISKISGTKINIKNSAKIDTKLLCNADKLTINSKIDVPKGSDILFENSSVSSNKYLRTFDIELEIVKEYLSINHIDYYILDNKKLVPLVTMSSKLNMFTGYLNELSFNVPQPLPTEFFNVLVGQRIFRNGTFSGNMQFVNSDSPHINGYMAIKDTILVGQMSMIRNLKLNADKNYVNIQSDGMIRRIKYDLNANVHNKIKFPIIVENINFSIDEANIEKLMQTFIPREAQAQRPQSQRQMPANRPVFAKSAISQDYFQVETKQEPQTTETSEETAPIVFSPNILEIKKCILNVDHGTYKKLEFGNLHANLTLTRNGILEIKSNKFDFAQGISTLKVHCDFMKEHYSIRLGAKDVDTDAISTSVLNLEKEISGKASALLEFYTDSSLKLNGKIQFAINEGSIAKLGLVEYILNTATIFRNPLVAISPTTFVDLVNIPDGSFNKIEGTLDIKNNIVEKLMIKSSSPQLSSFSVGRINLETMDVSLNIYTKVSNDRKDALGILRNVSLKSIARKASSYTKEETASYYAAQLSMLPKLESGEESANVYLTKIDGDLNSSNFISTLKKIK